MNSHNTPKNKNSQPTEGQKGAIVAFWKKSGETLAVMLRRFREEYHLDNEAKLTYAGRLDPMAEGVVPVLFGDARFQKDMLLGKTKTYEVEILLGISTDTGDMLGLTTSAPALSEAKGTSNRKVLAEIEAALAMLAKTVSLPYPNYSSRPVEGKPLFMHARANNAVVLPIKKVTIYNLESLSVKDCTLGDLVAGALAVIEKVQGDFRQKEIISQWRVVLEENSGKKVQMIAIRTTVSSGTYMRSLAEKMGKLLKVPALAYSIKRTSVEGIR